MRPMHAPVSSRRFGSSSRTTASSELSVGEVTRAARCNRGTFYYYFHDFDELVAIAIAQLLQDNELITDALWHFSSEGDLSAFDRRDVRCLLRRIVITMRAGAAEQVVQGIHTIIIDRVRRDRPPRRRRAQGGFELCGGLSGLGHHGLCDGGRLCPGGAARR